MNGNRHRKIEAVVFDFDGTLAELCLDFSEMKQRLALLAEEVLGSRPSPFEQPVLESLEIMLMSARQSNAAAASLLQRRAESLILDMELEAAGRGRLFPFSRALLEDLKQQCTRVAIITRNCERAVRLVFPDLEDYCSCFLAREHVPHVKPDPDHLLQAIRKLSASPEATLMIGDHPIDILTGKRAGVVTGGVWSGNASRLELLCAGADKAAKNCAELIRDLRSEGLL